VQVVRVNQPSEWQQRFHEFDRRQRSLLLAASNGHAPPAPEPAAAQKAGAAAPAASA
jgi:hypothetical protein